MNNRGNQYPAPVSLFEEGQGDVGLRQKTKDKRQKEKDTSQYPAPGRALAVSQVL